MRPAAAILPLRSRRGRRPEDRRRAHRALVLVLALGAAAGLTACQRPRGALDVAAEAATGGIRVQGWAIDPDTTAPAEVHVYVDGMPAGVLTTTEPRPDVAATLAGAPLDTGFDGVVPAGPGRHDVCVYGIDAVGGDGNALVRCQSVTVAAGRFPVGTTVDAPYGPLAAHRLDVHRPAGSAPRPAVVWIHGGGWVAGDKAEVYSSVLRYAETGRAVVVSVNYQLSTDGQVRFPVALGDIKRAVRWVKARAGDLGVDPDRIVVAGGSAGGHLAAMVGATAGELEPTSLPPALEDQDSTVAGVIDVVGISDFTTFWQAGGWAPDLQAEYLGCPRGVTPVCTDEQNRRASVAPYLHAGAPPAYIALGGADPLVLPATQGAPLAERWAAVRGGTGVVYTADPGRGHSFEVADDPGFAAWMDRVFAGGF